MKVSVTSVMLTLSFFSIQFPSAQQKTPSKINTAGKDTSQSLIAHWKKGETKSYSITHVKVRWEQGGKGDSSALTYWATIKVIDSSVDGYRLQWNYTLPLSGLNVPHANEIYEFYKGLDIMFETSQWGEFKGVTNWQELRDHYVKMLELSIPQKEDGKVDSALQKVKEMFNSKPMIEGTMAKEIMLLLQSYGSIYTTKGITVNTSIPNPFIPAKPIPAVLTAKLVEKNPNLDYFTLQMHQSIDRDGALQLFETVFEKMDLPKDSVMSMANEMFSSFDINDDCEMKASIKSGWVRSLYYIRKAISSELSQTDSYLIEEYH